MARAIPTQQIFEYYPGRQLKRIYITPALASSLNIAPHPTTGRLQIDTSDPNVETIYIQTGWFVVQAGTQARQRIYVQPEHITAVVWDTDDDLPEA